MSDAKPVDLARLAKASKAIYLQVPQSVADDISRMLNNAHSELQRLRERVEEQSGMPIDHRAAIITNCNLVGDKKELLDALEKAVVPYSWIYAVNGVDHYQGTSNYVPALRLLAKHNRLEIVSDEGGRVVAKKLEVK